MSVVSIVDDDEDVRLALESFVESMGWRARLYESAEQFLDSGGAEDTACLICDVRMPGLTGIEMHERLVARGIAPPTIFITAYPTAALQSKVASNGGLVLLGKPFSIAVVGHWLSVALGSP
ncbi:response regulator transcription factor [Trinickia mobilis]|uniref:response regulator transcription factor n=1 Tax=Trinickia mobilis TaxID=2816356 RepID=UPI001F5CCC59|nr:response regulator [Trinickia mobilis]